MWFNDMKAREAFRRGAREAFESCFVHMNPRQERAVSAWLSELDDWEGGDPPEPPKDW
jgi:hypothetical protein